VNRRRFLASTAWLALAGGLGRSLPAKAGPSARAIEARFRALETASQGRLGVQIVDTASGRDYGHRSDERFLMLSTFKVLACALVLHRVDAGQESLDRRVTFAKKDVIAWSPVTELHADRDGMSLAELCQATITLSDNTAANLILGSYGGPAALTDYLRKLGDLVTRLDRTEPDLNAKHPTGLWDTTTPGAMARTLGKLALGDTLSVSSRRQLQEWLLDCRTGDRRLKAGLPADWRIGDKTGTNATDACDIAVVWPADRPPLLVAAYLADSPLAGAAKDGVLAELGKLVREIA